jgi:thymidylate synthase (FAD)
MSYKLLLPINLHHRINLYKNYITKEHENHVTKESDNHVTKEHNNHETKENENHETKENENHVTKENENHVTKENENHVTKNLEYMGYVELIDIMPRIVPEGRSGDVAIVQGARISYGSSLKSMKEDDALIEYLVEHYHTSPLEMAEVKFIAKVPLFVFNQLVRHRTASLNCVSRRYTEIEKESFYIPELRKKDELNKQGSQFFEEKNEVLENQYKNMYGKANETYDMYKECVKNGVAKEVARGAMPQNIMTEFIWKIDLHNFLKMIQLRIHHTAQKEIRELAEAMYELVKPKFPAVCNAFEKHWLNKISFSEEEIMMIQQKKNGNIPEFQSKRKQKVFWEKLKRLGLVE